MGEVFVAGANNNHIELPRTGAFDHVDTDDDIGRVLTGWGEHAFETLLVLPLLDDVKAGVDLREGNFAKISCNTVQQIGVCVGHVLAVDEDADPWGFLFHSMLFRFMAPEHQVGRAQE